MIDAKTCINDAQEKMDMAVIIAAGIEAADILPYFSILDIVFDSSIVNL